MAGYVDRMIEEKEESEGNIPPDSWNKAFMPVIVAGAVFFAFTLLGKKLLRR